jgi:2'-5' RNA ligase
MSGERARLFVALALPSDLVAALSSWGPPALGSVRGLRFISASSLHVTLCFLGSSRVAECAALGDACALAVGANRRVAGLSLSEVLWLPRRRPRLVAVGVHDPSGALAALQADVASALVRRGWYQPEARPFMAHVTVARVGRGASMPPPAFSPPPEASLPALSFAGASVTLFRSHPGSVYEALRVITLDGDG